MHSYLGKHQLTLPRSGASFDNISDLSDIDDHDSSDNDEEQLLAATVIAVQQLDTLYTCINCKKSVKPGTKQNIGVCDGCGTMQKLSNPRITAKLFMQDKDQCRVTLRAYNETLKIIAQTDHVTSENLLLSPQLDVTYNKFHVTASAGNPPTTSTAAATTAGNPPTTSTAAATSAGNPPHTMTTQSPGHTYATP